MTAAAPLSGIQVVVFAGLGPVPYAAMLLADFGAGVTIIDRPRPAPASMPPEADPRRRGQRSIAIDLRHAAGRAVAEDLVRRADIVIEGLRPGAMERLGLGAERCQLLNGRVIYARLTGWGQAGPYAQMAGHDINYVGLSGALLAMGDRDSPPPVPLNLLGDYAGGGVFAVLGILVALVERNTSGQGQVVDSAILDGVASLCTAPLGMRNCGLWGERGENVFDGSQPWYRTYRTADGGYVAVGAIEDKFYAELLVKLGLDPADWPRQGAENVARLTAELERAFGSRPRDEWAQVFDGTDACVTPVLSFTEAVSHPQAVARGSYLAMPGSPQPSPAPRLSRTPGSVTGAPVPVGRDTDAILSELSLSPADTKRLRAAGTVR
jgi:alpha-methylacyl-CoA racemase